MWSLSSFTSVAFQDTQLPERSGSSELQLSHALALVNTKSGVLLSADGERISLPFTAEKDDRGFFLRSHVPKFRTGLVEQVKNQGTLEVLFDCGEYYIDPEWILRKKAHAPTEIKVVFSICGIAGFVECSEESALEHLDRVTKYKQLAFNSDSVFSVNHLPTEYVREMLPQILHFEVRVERVHVSQVMALTHLLAEQRMHILKKLDEKGDPLAREAAQIIRFFMTV